MGLQDSRHQPIVFIGLRTGNRRQLTTQMWRRIWNIFETQGSFFPHSRYIVLRKNFPASKDFAEIHHFEVQTRETRQQFFLTFSQAKPTFPLVFRFFFGTANFVPPYWRHLRSDTYSPDWTPKFSFSAGRRKTDIHSRAKEGMKNNIVISSQFFDNFTRLFFYS